MSESGPQTTSEFVEAFNACLAEAIELRAILTEEQNDKKIAELLSEKLVELYGYLEKSLADPTLIDAVDCVTLANCAKLLKIASPIIESLVKIIYDKFHSCLAETIKLKEKQSSDTYDKKVYEQFSKKSKELDAILRELIDNQVLIDAVEFDTLIECTKFIQPDSSFIPKLFKEINKKIKTMLDAQDARGMEDYIDPEEQESVLDWLEAYAISDGKKLKVVDDDNRKRLIAHSPILRKNQETMEIFCEIINLMISQVQLKSKSGEISSPIIDVKLVGFFESSTFPGVHIEIHCENLTSPVTKDHYSPEECIIRAISAALDSTLHKEQSPIFQDWIRSAYTREKSSRNLPSMRIPAFDTLRVSFSQPENTNFQDFYNEFVKTALDYQGSIKSYASRVPDYPGPKLEFLGSSLSEKPAKETSKALAPEPSKEFLEKLQTHFEHIARIWSASPKLVGHGAFERLRDSNHSTKTSIQDKSNLPDKKNKPR